MKLINSTDEIAEKDIYIYGAGMVAQLFINEIKGYSNKSINAVVVNKPSQYENSFYGLNIISLNDIINKQIPIVIATLSNLHIEISMILEKNGIKNCYAISESYFQNMRKHFVPTIHDESALKIKINEMKKLVKEDTGYVTYVTDTDIYVGYNSISTNDFLSISNKVEGTVFIFSINWDNRWEKIVEHAFLICDRFVISFRYKYIKSAAYSIINKLKEYNFQLSAQKKVYRDKRDFYTEDVILYLEKRSFDNVFRDKLCTGCGICSMICPTGALNMAEDEYGIQRPYCDPSKCIECNKCKRIFVKLWKKRIL